MRLTATTGPCVASEPPASRWLRLLASICALVAAVIVLLASLVNLLGMRTEAAPVASALFAAAAAVLVGACTAGFRVPRRTPVFLAGLASLVTLAFTTLGRGQSGLTYTTPHATRYMAAGVPLVGCLAAVVVTTHIAFWLARRHGCSCE